MVKATFTSSFSTPMEPVPTLTLSTLTTPPKNKCTKPNSFDLFESNYFCDSFVWFYCCFIDFTPIYKLAVLVRLCLNPNYKSLFINIGTLMQSLSKKDDQAGLLYDGNLKKALQKTKFIEKRIEERGQAMKRKLADLKSVCRLICNQ